MKNFAAYVQATRDDFCLFEVCKRLFDEGLKDFFFSIPDEYWSGRPTPAAEIEQVVEVAARLQAAGANARHKIFSVKPHRHPGLSRVDVETRVRNESVDWIRATGFDHIVIVDGDELWKRNVLSNAVRYVEGTKPSSIAIGMIPTIGLPGYPIEGAKDMATIYIGPGVKFTECRKPDGLRPAELLQVRGIIHFTATRRTMAEIIEKHRDSGHYDDPAYDFEGWIAHVLPRVHVGMRNAHMFKHYQIWPVVRSWRPDEWAEIPESVRQYLGAPT